MSAPPRTDDPAVQREAPNSFDARSSVRLSLVFATKNRARFFEAALGRAASLKGPQDELIVIDGQSNDGTVDILRRNSGLIDFFVSEPDSSEGNALNKGLLLARGRYVKLMTDDDVIVADGLKQAIATLDNNPDLELLLCGGVKIRGSTRSPVYVPPGAGYGSSIDTVFRYGACGIGLLFRRSALARVGLLDPRAFSIDVDFVARAVASGARVSFARIYLFQHEIYPHSGAGARRDALKADIERIRRTYLGRRRYWVDCASNDARKLLVAVPGLKSIKNAMTRADASMATSVADGTSFWDGGFS